MARKKVVWPVHGNPPRTTDLVPVENTRINLGANTQANVDPALSPSLNPNWPGNAPWRGNVGYQNAFQYGALQSAPDLGAQGSIIGTLGGHSAYFGNEVVRFDIATRLFAHLSDPYSSNSHPGSFYTDGWQHSDADNGELYINAGLATDPTQPTSFHPYNTNVVLPPDSEIGTGAKGGLLSTIRAARSGPVEAGNHSRRSHLFDLAQSNRATACWARYSSNLWSYDPPVDRFGYGWATYDPTRKKVFMGVRGQFYNKLSVLNCVTRQWETPITLSQNVYMFASRAAHWQANPNYIINLIMHAPFPDSYFELINVATGQVYTPGMTGTAPSAQGGWDFVQSANKIALYEGGVASVNRVWILTPPSTTDAAVFTTTPWTWSFEDVTGPTPPVQTLGADVPHLGRFLWAEKVKCFIWWANGADNVQAWRVRGFN